jgi:signal peptidase I
MNEPVGLNSKKASKPQEGGIGEHIKVIVQALLIALFVRTILFQPFNIPSGSLIPTLLIGDYLFVSKYSYGYSKFSLPLAPPVLSGRIMASEPKRGDILVRSAGVCALVDAKTALYLKGTHIDYSNQLIAGGFKFTNPNAKASCSCGESFSV